MIIFAESPEDRSLERMMVTIPGFKPTGHGTYIFGKNKLIAEMYDCKLCLYYKEMQKSCLLKQCPCLEERILVGSASRKEILTNLATMVKIPAFKKRVIQHLKESEIEPVGYRNEKHLIAFAEAIQKLNRKDYALMSAVYLLTAEHALWMKAKHRVKQNEISFDAIKLQSSTENAYTLFCCAKDLYLGTKHITIKDLADKDLISPKIFGLICNAMAIRRFGLGAIHYKERKSRS